MKLKDIERGATFAFGDSEWIVLEHDDTGHTLALSREIIGNMPFDTKNNNNWAESTIRKYLNGDYLDKLCEGTEPEKLGFAPYHLDLTADDGLKDYGITTDFIFLLTCDLYRKNRDVIDPICDWWWLATAYSACASSSCYSRGVGTGGALGGSDACYGGGGVRPACYLDSNILVSNSDAEVDEAIDAAEKFLQLDDRQRESVLDYIDFLIAKGAEKNEP